MSSTQAHGKVWRTFVFRHGIRATKVTKTKREGVLWGAQREAELDLLKVSGGHTFADAVDRYLRTVSTTKKEGAADWERRRFSPMLEFFEPGTPITQITSDDIALWRDKRLETVGGSTIQREANLLRHLFTTATEEWKWLKEHPFKGVRLPKEANPRQHVWRWQQIRRVLRAGQRSGGKIQETTHAFHIALRTAMRLKEALAAPAQFDARRRVVSTDTKMVRDGATEDIPVGRAAAKLLDRAPFRVRPNEASTLFAKLTKSLMIEDRTFHDARATALTLMSKKMDVMRLARVSRHKDINLLYNTYYRTTADEIAAEL